MAGDLPDDGSARKRPPVPRPRAAHSPEALAALRNLATPQPRSTDQPGYSPPPGAAGSDAGGSGSATGFVGMLAKGQVDAGDSRMGMPSDDAARRRYSLEMAREVALPIAATPADVSPAMTAVPAWYPSAAIAAWLLAALLLVIGAWAVGALIYMQRVKPEAPGDVHYPLIRWSYEVGIAGGFTPDSRLMAWAMVACLPVAIAAAAVGAVLRRRRQRAAVARS